jgi:hypothetical protein
LESASVSFWHIGPITPEVLATKVKPAIAAMLKEAP